MVYTFLNLLHADNSHIDEQRKEQVISELNNYGNINSNNGNLNYKITENELTEASRKLKTNKVSAQDLIKNEMIKSALPVLNKPIVKIFNTTLTTGQFSR